MKEIIVQYLLEAAVLAGLLIVSCIMIIVMTNKQIKTWIKTLVFLAITESVAAFLGWIAWKTYCNGNLSGAIIAAITAAILALSLLWGGIKGHRQSWSHVDSVI